MLFRLESMAVRRVAVPLRLLQIDEEELPDEIDTVSLSLMLLFVWKTLNSDLLL